MTDVLAVDLGGTRSTFARVDGTAPVRELGSTRTAPDTCLGPEITVTASDRPVDPRQDRPVS